MSTVFDMKDQSGNEYYLLAAGKLYLQLINERHPRLIGILKRTKDGKIVLHKDVKPTNIFQRNDSFGIPYDIINKVDGIQINCDGIVYRIKSSDALSKGSFLWFKHQGFERQFFIERKHFLQTKTNLQ